MRKNKIIVIIILFLLSVNLFSEDEYFIERIKEEDYVCEYEAEGFIKNLAKEYITNNSKISNEDFNTFRITDLHKLSVGGAKIDIILVEFSIDAIPFIRDYLVELYYDTYKNFIKAEFISLNDASFIRKNYPIKIK